MSPEIQHKQTNEKGDMSLKELIGIIKGYVIYLIKKVWIIAAVTVVCIIAGFVVGRSIKPSYIAQTTFVLQESGSSQSNDGGLAMLGLGGGKKAGLFEGNNLKWLYSTRLMLQKALFVTVKKGNDNILLINWFLDIDPVAQETMEKNPAFKAIRFQASDLDSSSSEMKNQLVNFCVGRIKTKYLSVKDVEKTDGVIEVDIVSSNQEFAKTMAKVLVDNVNQYYVQSKVGNLSGHVKELENQVLEYSGKMNSSLYSTAEAVDAVPYPNPNNQVNLVAPKRKGIDADLNSSLYIQLMKSLETSRMELQKATPLIQVIDAPVLPLPTSNKSTSYYMVLLGALGALLTCVVLIFTRLLKNAMAA